MKRTTFFYLFVYKLSFVLALFLFLINTTLAATFTVDLHPGQEHSQVKLLQQYLNQNGYTIALSGDGSLGLETTIMGKATVAALKRFQAANGINQTGIVGELTRIALNKTKTSTPPKVNTTPTTPKLFTVDLHPGQEHSQVKLLQQYLNQNGYTIALSGDGSLGLETTIMGKATVAALKRFQAANGINQTGIVGELTRVALNRNRTTTISTTPTYTPPTPTTPKPRISLTATPNPVKYNTKTKLTWSATNANYCLTSFNKGKVKLNGTYTSKKLTKATTFSVTCYGPEVITSTVAVAVLAKKRGGGGGGGGGGGSSSSAVNGVCGSAHTQSFATAPSTDLCTSGTASSVSGAGPFTWSCLGSGGGSTASCSAGLTPSTAATAVTLTGPTSGTVSVASTNFTVGANGTISGTIIVTPAATGGGTFTPTTRSLTSSSPTATFTYTPSSTGGNTIIVTNNAGLTNPSSISYTASAAAATTVTLTLISTGTTGTPTNGYVTLNGMAPSAGSVTLVGAGATFSPASLSWSSGESGASKSFTITRATNGTTAVSITNTMSLTNAGAAVYTSSAATFTSDLPISTTLTSTVTGIVPFTIGQAFKQGAVSGGDSLTGLQTNVLTYWPDGSVKHAIVSGTASMTSGTPYALAMTVGSPATGITITTSDLATALSQDITITAGAFGSAVFGASDWISPQQTVASGPRLSSWTYRKQIGSDAHLVAWLEIRMWSTGHVEVFPWVENGYLTVAGPTNKSSTYTFTLGGTQRFSQAIDIKHHTRIPLINTNTGQGSVRTFSHWLGTDPGVVPAHDGAYLMESKVVPNFAWGGPSGTALDAAAKHYTPNTTAGDENATGAAGGAGNIISESSARYLTSGGDVRAWKAMLTHGLSSGSWSHHYRDNNTNLPLAYSTYATRAVDDGGTPAIPGGSGGVNSVTPAAGPGGGPALTHMPSYAYLPYLVTGRWWFLEEMHFWTTYVFITRTPAYRENGNAVIGTRSGYNARGGAWALNVTAQSASVTPPSHPLQAQFVASWQNSMAHLYGTYVSGTLEGGAWVSPQGILGTHNSTGNSDDAYAPPNASSAWWDAGWMHNYLAAVLGYTSDMGLPQSGTSQSQHIAVRNSAYKSVIARADDGYQGRYNWRRFIVFAYPMGSDDIGVPVNIYFTASQSYAELVSGYGLNTSLPSNYGLSLKQHSSDIDLSSGDSSRTYGSTAFAALALAAEHAVPGAVEGYDRVTAASNYASSFSTYLADEAPNWGIKPRLPNDLPGVNTVVDWTTNTMDDAAGRSRVSFWRIWGDATYMPGVGRFGAFASANGGHGDNYHNDIVQTDVGNKLNTLIKPAATVFRNPNSGGAPGDVADGGEGIGGPPYHGSGTGWLWATSIEGNFSVQTGEPGTTHAHAATVWLPESAFPGESAPNGWLYRPSHLGFYPAGQSGTFTAHRLRVGDALWQITGPTFSGVVSSGGYGLHSSWGSAYDPVRRRVWYKLLQANLALGYRELADGSANHQVFTSGTNNPAGYIGGFAPLFYSSRHDLLVHLADAADIDTVSDYTKIVIFDPITGIAHQPTQTGAVPTLGVYTARTWSDKWNSAVFYPGDGSNIVYFCKPTGDPRTSAWVWSSITVTGSVRSAEGVESGGTLYYDTRTSYTRLRLLPILGNYVWWGARSEEPSQLIHVTPP